MDNILAYSFRDFFFVCIYTPMHTLFSSKRTLYTWFYKLSHNFLGRRASSQGKAGSVDAEVPCGLVGREFLQERKECPN